MVCSLDGYIASKDNDIAWMHSSDHYENGIALSESEIVEFLKTIDCYVMGSNTYEHTFELGWPYGDKPAVVLTKRNLPLQGKNVSFYKGPLTTLINKHLKPKYQNIWVVGGAETAKACLKAQLIDELVVNIMPILIGNGLPFFDTIEIEQPLHLAEHKAYKDGMVELRYVVKRRE